MSYTIGRRRFLKLAAAVSAGLAVPSAAARAPGGTENSTPGCLEIVSVRPERPHLVAPGHTTTFVVAVTNPGAVQTSATLSVRASSDGWTATVSRADRLFQVAGPGADSHTFQLQAGERLLFAVQLSPGQALAQGQIGSAEVSATIQGQPACAAVIWGKVSSVSKVYFAVYDGLGRDYTLLDRQGTYANVDTDPLTPNFRSFLGDSAYLSQARSLLPSLTDPNHVAALTGSWPGTSGAYAVTRYYAGRDDYGEPIWLDPSARILRFGAAGAQVRSVFHVAKDSSFGGDPDALNAMVLGKSWIGAYFSDGQNTVDVFATGSSYPNYVPPPEPYPLGDPQTDDDPLADRDGWNLTPPEQFRMNPRCDIYGCVGDTPDQSPSDRWVVESALLIIAAEDPDVLYILPGNVDHTQHHSGTADKPEEWRSAGDPEALWDDYNHFNRHANRDPVLDVVHEADDTFGLLVATLQGRGTYDDSIVVLASDHGQITSMYRTLPVAKICGRAGVSPEVFDLSARVGAVGLYWLTDLSYAAAIESALQAYVTHHPVLGQDVMPFVVLTRGEMETGVDDVLGRVAASGGPKRAELYSEWCIDYPVDDHTKPKWPDLIIFSRYRYQVAPDMDAQPLVGTHGSLGWEQQIPLAIRGPAFTKAVFDQLPASLVDIAPTLYHVQGWGVPANVDGRLLSEILA
jgi:arylsulfatase A-like enzyme